MHPMNYVVLLFSLLLFVAGIVLMVRPAVIMGFIERHSGSLALHVCAVLVRLLLGFALLISASESRLPLFLEIVGWITIVAALVLAFMGRSRFRRVVEWATKSFRAYVRVIGVAAMMLAGLLAYALI